MSIWFGRRLVAVLVSLVIAAGVSGASAESADCLTSAGKTACGFYCVASDGDVRCAQTVEGACSVSSGTVACWDPPSALRRVFGARVPRPSCVSSDGQTACGYSCETTNGRAQCADTPFGRCAASDGNLVCWDPPAAVYLSKKARTPEPECVTSLGKVACGYHCMSRDGELRCAQTPEGTCQVQQGNLVCWDPPLDSYEVVFSAGAEQSCLDGEDSRSCGYHCLATPLHSACGASRTDSCRVVAGAITCGARSGQP